MQFKKLITVAPLVASVLAAPAAAPVNGIEPVGLLEMEVQTFDFVADPNTVAADLEDRVIDVDTKDRPAARDLKDRDIIGGIVTSIVLNVAGDLLTPYVKQGITLAGNLIKDLGNWKDAREQFTKATVLSMWQSNPDPAKYPAVVCYNMGYHLDDPQGMAGWAKAKLKKSLLHTDYDCFYMTAPNTFHGDGDGGFINFASLNNKSRCTFNSGERTISCQ